MTTPNEVQTRGPFVAEYSGVGRFTFTDGRLSEDYSFWAGQALNGQVFIYFDENALNALIDFDSHLARFSGVTDSGLNIEACSPLPMSNKYIFFMEAKYGIVISAKEIRLTVAEPRNFTSVRYGLTNFLFLGTEGRELEYLYWQRVLPLKLDYQGNSVAGYICETSNYSSASNTLRAVGGIQVTAEFVIDLSLSQLSDTDCKNIADALCRVLSVARGTHIAWIYKVSLDSTGNPVTRVHSNRITRDYHDGLPLLSDSPDDAEPTQVFAETTFPAYVVKSSEYMLDGGSLDTYLEAKSEEQYLEMRALKATVAMEMLAARHCSSCVAPQFNLIINPTVFNSLIEELSSSICDIVLRTTKNKKDAKRVAGRGRVLGLNQRSLGERIQRMWKGIGLLASPQDAKLFAVSRNCLAHTGRFACSPENRATVDGQDIPWSTSIEEYGFLMSLLDRTILRILDYDGPYINWHRLDHFERRTHVNG